MFENAPKLTDSDDVWVQLYYCFAYRVVRSNPQAFFSIEPAWSLSNKRASRSLFLINSISVTTSSRVWFYLVLPVCLLSSSVQLIRLSAKYNGTRSIFY